MARVDYDACTFQLFCLITYASQIAVRKGIKLRKASTSCDESGIKFKVGSF